MRIALAAIATALTLLFVPAVAGAQTEVVDALVEDEGIRTAFDREWALGIYTTGWLGDYAGAGAGGRLRWEPFELLGIDVWCESLIVEWPGGLRHDHPVGFNLYVPITIVPEVRIRPMLGLCASFSLIEPSEQDGPRADDVQFAIHGGAGIEFSPDRRFSFFVEVQAFGYLGHDRTAEGWTGSVDEGYTYFGTVQGAAGFQVHI